MVGRGCSCSDNGSRCEARPIGNTWMGIPSAMPDRMMPAGTADNANMAKAATGRKPVDEKRCRSVGARKVALKHGHIEGQRCALELRFLQNDNRVLYRR